MAVQPIFENRILVGYQVRVPSHPRTLTRYFAVRKYGASQARAQAYRAERELERQATPRQRGIQANNRSLISGIRVLYREHGASGVPVMHVQASWSRQGRKGSTDFSTEKHGRVGACELAIAARERGSGEPVGLSPRQVWNTLQRSLES